MDQEMGSAVQRQKPQARIGEWKIWYQYVLCSGSSTSICNDSDLEIMSQANNILTKIPAAEPLWAVL
jgi:hypothetical protein